MRIIAVILGLLALGGALASFLPGVELDLPLSKLVAWVSLGVTFLAYGIGGQSILEKVAPQFAEKTRKKLVP